MDYEELDELPIKKNKTKKTNKIKNCKKYDEPDDISDLFIHIFNKFNIKIAILIFIFYIFINTSFFIENILSYFSNSVIGDSPTEYGILIQGIMISIFYIVISLLNESEII